MDDAFYDLRHDPPRDETLPARRAWWRGAKARWNGIRKSMNPFRHGNAIGHSQYKFEYMWNKGWTECSRKMKCRKKEAAGG